MGKDKEMLIQKNYPEGEEQSQGLASASSKSSHMCRNVAEGGERFGYGWFISKKSYPNGRITKG